ncbi:hypothetical protein CPC08DRAFT_767101 [Agrocybe pediades]|nr:hypothetical protein CPC08DRAFT_767101 [Agrocybe pediades]
MVFASGLGAFKRVLVLATILQVALLAAARPQPLQKRAVEHAELQTNAERLSAGLTPLAPRNLYNPSRVGARSPAPSTLPPVSGNILVKRVSTGQPVGYVEKTLLLPDIGVTKLDSLKMSISFTPSPSPFNIAINGHTAYPYLGFSGTTLLSTTPFGFGLSATNPTSPNEPSSNVGNAQGGRSQSAVWSYSAATGELTPQFVNPDGSKHSVYLWYFPLLDKIRLVRASQVTGYQVTFTVA